MADIPPPSPNPLPDPRRGGLPRTLGEDAAQAAAELEHLRRAAQGAAQATEATTAGPAGHAEDDRRYQEFRRRYEELAARQAAAEARARVNAPPVPPRVNYPLPPPTVRPPAYYEAMGRAAAYAPPTPPQPQATGPGPQPPPGPGPQPPPGPPAGAGRPPSAPAGFGRPGGAAPAGAASPPAQAPPPPPAPVLPPAVVQQLAQIQQRAAQVQNSQSWAQAQRMADLGARAMAAAGPVAMAAAAGSHVWGRVVDTVRTSDPMVGDTYDKSYELAKARVGHDFAPAVDYASSALQAGSEFWSKGTPEAKRIRQFGLLAPLITPIGAAAVAAGFRTEPERSFAGLPSGGRTSLEQYALGLGGAAVSTGPLEQRLLEERYKSFTNPGGEKAWWDAPIAAGAGAGMAGLRALFDALTGNVRDVADNTEKDPHDFGRW